MSAKTEVVGQPLQLTVRHHEALAADREDATELVAARAGLQEKSARVVFYAH
jgi:hypothetical protein